MLLEQRLRGGGVLGLLTGIHFDAALLEPAGDLGHLKVEARDRLGVLQFLGARRHEILHMHEGLIHLALFLEQTGRHLGVCLRRCASS